MRSPESFCFELITVNVRQIVMQSTRSHPDRSRHEEILMNQVKIGSEKKVDFSFRTRPLIQTTDGILFNFLNAEVVMSKKEAIMMALSTYWSSLAYQYRQELSCQRLQQIAANGIYRLELHKRSHQEILEIIDFKGDNREISPLKKAEGRRKN